MGGVSSTTNEVSTAINSAIGVVNSYTSNCTESASNYSDITICGSNINIPNGITVDQLLTVKQTCVSNAQFNTNISQAVQEDLVQKAQSTVEALSMGYADAQNYVNASINLSQEITNTFKNTCSPAINNYSNISLGLCDKTGATVDVGFINVKQVTDAVQSCISNAVSNSTAAQQMNLTVNQQASSTTQGLTSILKWIAIIIAIIIGIILIGFVIFLLAGGTKVIGAAVGSGSSGGSSSSSTPTVSPVVAAAAV